MKAKEYLHAKLAFLMILLASCSFAQAQDGITTDSDNYKGTIKLHETQKYKIDTKFGSRFTVRLKGDEKSNLDLYLCKSDQNFTQLAKDVGPSSIAKIDNDAPGDRYYVVKVKNQGDSLSAFSLEVEIEGVPVVPDTVENEDLITPKGPVGGQPLTTKGTISPRKTIFYRVKLEGNEETVIELTGDGNADLDLYLCRHDGRFTQIKKSVSNSSYEELRFTPTQRGTYVVKVKNQGNYSSAYHLVVRCTHVETVIHLVEDAETVWNIISPWFQ